MNNNNQGSFQQMPMVVLQQQPQQGFYQEQQIPPARVRVALEFLGHLTLKTMPRAAVSDVGIEWAELPKLTSTEEFAAHSACDLLSKYFDGKLESNNAEKLDDLRKSKNITGQDGIMIRCVACNGSGPSSCKMCKGSGSVLVTPSIDE